MTLPAIGVIGLVFMCLFIFGGIGALVVLSNDDLRFRLCEVLASYRSPRKEGTVGKTGTSHKNRNQNKHSSKQDFSHMYSVPSSAFGAPGQPPVIDQQAYARTQQQEQQQKHHHHHHQQHHQPQQYAMGSPPQSPMDNKQYAYPNHHYPQPHHQYSHHHGKPNAHRSTSPSDSGNFSYPGGMNMPNSSVSSAEKELKGILRNSKRTTSPTSENGQVQEKKRTKSVHMDDAVTKVQIHS